MLGRHGHNVGGHNIQLASAFKCIWGGRLNNTSYRKTLNLLY